MLTLERWRGLAAKQRAAEAARIADAARGALVLLRMQDTELGLPVFAHLPSKIVFHLVPGGTYRIGFSEEEWAVLEQQYMGWDEALRVDAILEDDAMRPVIDVTLKPFLLAARPLDGTQLEYVGATPAERATLEASLGRKRWDFEKVKKLPAAAYLKYLDESSSGNLETWDDVARTEQQLAALGLRLPSDSEWEAAARAGRYPCPFASGTEIPDHPNIGANPFGFVDLGSEAEVCSERVVKGGAGNVYPWQGPGWTLLLCAARGDGSDDEGFYALRPALDLVV